MKILWTMWISLLITFKKGLAIVGKLFFVYYYVKINLSWYNNVEFPAVQHRFIRPWPEWLRIPPARRLPKGPGRIPKQCRRL